MPAIHWIEVPSGRIGTMRHPTGQPDLVTEITALRDQGATTLVCALPPHEMRALGLADEPAVCAASGLKFVPIPIEDFDVPTSAAAFAERIDAIIETLRAGRTVVVHCRAGIGRSSLIVAAILCVMGSTQPAAWQIISAARGVPVPETVEQGEWLDHFVRLR